MRTIKLLDQKTIDKISAGEVVERPASVVKELVENAIDARATEITIEIKEGGISFIRITDNGYGIKKEEVRLAFLRHATSKIRTVEDLVQIASLGFRGEALSSISAVAEVELITKTPEALTGIRYCIEGGIEKTLEEIGAPTGTTFLVHHLFYNTPARMKFLKSIKTEGKYVSTIVEQLALSHPKISFKYIQNGQNKLYTSGQDNLKEIVYQIYGRSLIRELIVVDTETPLMKISGLIGCPSVARGNRNFENYFVNGRYVKSKLLVHAIEEAYQGFMMQHRYPFTLLYLEINGDKVDVNVHPSKMELRFSNQVELYHQLYLALKNAILSRERIPKISLEKENFFVTRSKRDTVPKYEMSQESCKQMKKNYSTAVPLMSNRKQENVAVSELELLTKKSALYKSGNSVSCISPETISISKAFKTFGTSKKNVLTTVPDAKQIELFSDRLLSEEARKNHRIIGQVFETYWLMEYQHSLYIIDQHAAHEKVLYERMIKEYREQQITSQMLCPPMIISLSTREQELLKQYLEYFRKFGYDIEEFGGKEYKICAIPYNFYRVEVDQLFTEILDKLEDLREKSPDLILERLASMSCKAAIKGNQSLSRQEVENLLEKLLSLENPYNCPHGRATIMSISRYDLDKHFKRIL